MGRILVQPLRLINAQGQSLGRVVVEALEIVGELGWRFQCAAGNQRAVLIIIPAAGLVFKPEFQRFEPGGVGLILAQIEDGAGGCVFQPLHLDALSVQLHPAVHRDSDGLGDTVHIQGHIKGKAQNAGVVFGVCPVLYRLSQGRLWRSGHGWRLRLLLRQEIHVDGESLRQFVRCAEGEDHGLHAVCLPAYIPFDVGCGVGGSNMIPVFIKQLRAGIESASIY